MQTTPKPIHGFTFATLFIFALCLLHPLAVNAQWTTADGNGNINSTNTNNVGIGTTTPNYKLDVSNLVDKGQIRFGLGALDSGGFLFSNAPSHAVFSGGTSWNGGWFAKAISASLIMANNGSLVFFANNGLTSGSSYVPTERMRIDPSGFIGIGTQFPAFDGNTTKYFTLDGGTGVFGSYGVGGNVSNTTGVLGQFAFFNSNIAVAEKRNAVIVSSNDGATNSGNMTFYTANAGTLGERLRIDKSGNIGIASTAPADLLQIDTGSGWGMRIRYTGDGTYLRASSNQVSAFNSAGTAVNLFLNPTGGKVGIGTTTPGASKLDVQGGSINASGGLCIAGVCKTDWSQVGGSQWSTSGTTINYSGGNVTVGAGAVASGPLPGFNVALGGNSYIATSDGTRTAFLGADSSGYGMVGTLTNADFVVRSNNTERIRVGSGGNVGVGNANPGSLLFVGPGSVAGGALPGVNVALGASTFITASDGTRTSFLGADASGGMVGTFTNQDFVVRSNNTERIRVAAGGNVGIGNASPSSKLHVTGDGRFTGNLTVDGNIAAKYQDVAEWVPASEELLAGTVVILDASKTNHIISSSTAYDTRVAGVISEQPGIALGERGDNKALVATTGRVLVNVDASRGPIHVGDLLVTSDIAGVAMKSDPVSIGGIQIHRPGTIVGKALEPLEKGSGKILVLLSLQ